MASNRSYCLAGTEPVLLHNEESCHLGFYCKLSLSYSTFRAKPDCPSLQGPNVTRSNPPQFCPPTIECQITRLQQTLNTCRLPQGVFEPIVCQPGSYCPPGGKIKFSCPPGHFCPIGSHIPTPCSYGAICPGGSQRQIYTMGFTAIIVLDILLLLIINWPSLRGFYRKFQITRLSLDIPPRRTETESNSRLSVLPVTNIDLDGIVTRDRRATTLQTEKVEDDELELFIKSLARCVDARNLGLAFTFANLGLKLKNDREILAGVTGYIESGSMWGVMGASGAGKCKHIA